MSRKSSTSSSSSDESKTLPPYSGPAEKTLEPSSLLDNQKTLDGHEVEQISPEKKIKYPYSVFFIIVNEFCERFSYYGMRTVLTLYFKNALHYDDDLATVMYHVFIMLCYFTPILGALVADAWAGKFYTILSLSIVYAIGEIILTVSAIPNTLPQEAFSLVGLFIIAIGTGGIKPCVSAFGGDQFVRPQQDRQLEAFFSVFYFAINAGSLISTFLTPILREEKCFGMENCFPLAFGVPAILMIVAVVIFVLGKPLYKIKKPEGNILMEVSRCIGRAISNKWKARKTKEKRDHWLDFASDKCDKQLIEDVKRVLSVLVLYLPVPIFWTLFDQQGSRWTLQATRMDGGFGEDKFALKPDQMQIVNPLFILALVPIFESLVYPCFAKCNLLTPLQRMASGGIIAGIAFLISAVVELQLEPTYAKIPGSGLSQLDFYNTLPCPVNIHYVVDGDMVNRMLNSTDRFKFGEDPDFIKADNYTITADLVLSQGLCGGLTVAKSTWEGNIEATSKMAHSVMITLENENLYFKRMENEITLEKTDTGFPRVGFVFNLVDDNTRFTNITMIQGSKIYTFLANVSASGNDRIIQTEVKDVEVGTYKVFIPDKGSSSINQSEAVVEVSGSVQLLVGGCYVAVIQRSLNGSADNIVWNFQVTSENSIHMMWLIPQYFVMTIGEVLMSVTGLQFSFTQAPVRMRAVLQSMWQLTVAFGNLIDIIVAAAKGLPRQSDEFFLFAGLMFLDMIIFIFLATRYVYVSTDEDKKPLEGSDGDSSISSSSSMDNIKAKANGEDNKAIVDTPI